MVLGALIAVLAQVAETPDAAFARPFAGALTIAPEEQSLEIGVGVPSLVSLGYRHGVRSGLDLGVRASFTAGLEGMILPMIGSNLMLAPGAKAQALLALRLAERGQWTWGVTAEPGVFALWVTPVVPNAQPQLGIGVTLPLDLRATIALSQETAVTLSLSSPLWFTPGPNWWRVAVPLLVGVGYEQVLGTHAVFVVRARGGLAAMFGGGLAPEIDLRGGVAFRW